ncbi:hypothetical protein EV426DRAFT_712228 [Tirmania nivea]|nr:hypothetical protein EV426DRAFT_712228 [Tirmania nivea]
MVGSYAGNPIDIVFIIIALVLVFVILAFGPKVFYYIQKRRQRRQELRATADEEAVTLVSEELTRQQTLAHEFEESTGVVAGLGAAQPGNRGGAYLVLDKKQSTMFRNLSVTEPEMDSSEEVKRPPKLRLKQV